MSSRIGVLVAVGLAVAAAVPSPAQARASGHAVPDAVARAVVAQIPGASLRDDPDPAGTIDPAFNVPGAGELLSGRADVMLDPDFWVAAVTNLLQSGSIILPTPIDVVKPEAFLPTSPIANGPRPSALPRQDLDLSKITYEWQGRPKTIRQFLRTTETDIVAFVHDGRIIADFYENGWSPDVRHQPWSVTKSFISAVVGIAIDEGRVRSVDDPIDRYVTELRGTAWEGVTIQNLLQMESGVHWDEDTPVLVVNTQVEQWIQAALDLVTDGQLGQGRNAFLKSLPKVAEQGTKFSYNSGNTQVLAWLAETVYGKPFNEIVSEKLWQPAGMAGDARILTDRVGDAIASQGLYSRVFDLARFGELFRHGGRTPDGVQVVPEAWTRESTTMTEVSRRRYAYQWWAGPTPGSYQASGFQGQKISVSPDHCLTGVRLSHAFGLDTRPGDKPADDPDAYAFGTEFAGEEWNQMYRAVAAHLGTCGKPAAVRERLRLGRTGGRSRALALRRRALRVRVGASGRTMTVKLSASQRVRRTRGSGTRTLWVASRRLVVRPGPARMVSVPLTREGLRWLRGVRRAVLTVRATADGSDTARLRATRRMPLR
ncbi:serine hydrolase domain-containing protein [Paraconexibacter sp.]|uniref:serine hydrolase domain-containing protein n=1 Tax=Paraconexibacter sp. TaxID=2949640 RepID=UPI003563A461